MLGGEHLDTLTSMNNFAFTLKGQGHDEEAIRLLSECVRLKTLILGIKHLFTLSSAGTLDSWKLESLDITRQST